MGRQHGITPNSGNKLVIVPDSCSLILSTTQIPEEYFIKDPTQEGYLPPQKRPKRFIDIYMSRLPRDKVNGMHILDIIGGELFGRDATGRYYDESFKDPRHPSYDRLKTLGTALYDPKNTEVLLIPTSAGKPLIQILKDIAHLKQTIKDYAAHLPVAEAQKVQDDAADLLQKLRNKLAASRGENIIKEYLLAHPQPTLFLSDDSKARKRVIAADKTNHFGCIYVCNTASFLGKLKEAGVFENCGFEPWVTPEQMTLHMHKEYYGQPPTGKLLHPEITAIPGTVRQSKEPKPITDWFTR